METSHLVGGAVGLGVITAFWDKIKLVFSKIASLFIVRVHVEGHAAQAISLYCWSNLKRSPFGERRYAADTEYVRSLRRYQKIGYEEIGKDPIIFWNGWRPLLLGQKEAETGKNGQQNSVTWRQAYTDAITMTFFRFTFDPDRLVTGALDLLNKRHERGAKAKRFAVYRIFGSNNGEATMQSEPLKTSTFQSRFALGDKRVLKWNLDDLGPMSEQGGKALENVALPDDSAEMIEEIICWKESEKWYRARGIPWRRGWLLHGKPGTGKTSLVRAIAEDLDLPIFVFDLSTLCNRSFQQYWQEMFNWIPCIALIEDIDSVFDGRKNIQRTDLHGGLTFDCFLNCLDGVETSNGVFTIITTNNLDKIDEALADPNRDLPARPGRIDRVLELSELTEAGRKRIAQRILKDHPERIEAIINEGEGDTGARFTERCSRVALARFWKQPEPEGDVVVRPQVLLSTIQEEAPEAQSTEPVPIGPIRNIRKHKKGQARRPIA